MPFPKLLGGAGNSQKEIEPLPTEVETWLLAPVSAPDFSLPDLNGKSQRLFALRGKTVLLNFWATGSVGWREDLKVLNQVHQRWTGTGSINPRLQLLAVNLDDSANGEKAQALARELHLSFTILRGSDDVAGTYNILYRYLFDRHRDLALDFFGSLTRQLGNHLHLHVGDVGIGFDGEGKIRVHPVGRDTCGHDQHRQTPSDA